MMPSRTPESPMDRGAGAAIHDLADALRGRAATAIGGPRAAAARPADDDLTRDTELNLGLFADYLRRGVEPSEQDSAELVDLAVEQVRAGVPLAEVLDRHRRGTAALWTRVREQVGPSDHAVLLDAAPALLDYITLITARVATAAALDPWRELAERRLGIAEALLGGRDPVDCAGDPVIPVAEAFLVAVFRLGDAVAPAAELRHGVETLPGVFLRPDPRGWTALLPLRTGDEDGALARAALAALLPGADRPGLWVGAVTAGARADIPAARAEAAVLAELGRCLVRREILCHRADLHVEYAVAVGVQARAGLAAVLAPLDGQPMLAETLEAFVDNGFNQVATARALSVHRNTITYRLARVQELTGCDPHRPADAMTLSAALLARRLTDAAFTP